YYVIAGLSMYASGKCIGLDGTNIRIINNKLEGLKSQAYGIIHPIIGNGFPIYGNEFFGATSGNKKDHPIYVGYGSDNVDIGWNYFHDNNVAEGPVISVNTDYAVTEHYKFDNIRIHDNTMDCAGARGIGLVAMDYGSTVHIYNNVISNSGNNAIYMFSSSAYIYNNVFYNSKGTVIYMQTVLDAGNYYKPETVEIKNNIFSPASACEYLVVNNESEIGSITVSNNAFYGNGNGPSRDGAAVNANPLFVNASAGDFHLQANSLLIDKGVGIAAVKTDKDGVMRPQGRATDIGAYEYYTGGTSAGTGTGTGTVPGGDQQGQAGGPDGDQAAVPPTDGVNVGGGVNGWLVGAGEMKVIGSKDGQGTVNPGRGESAWIYFQGSETGNYKCRILTLTGEQVWDKDLTGVDRGMIEWSPRDIASGVYIVHLRGPGINVSKRVAILR
ncbi:MAG: choice-of-anchor Q domain-containing protein, partial [Endomicrobiales bacterium]